MLPWLTTSSWVRAGFASLLDAEEDIDVVGEAADGQEAVQVAARARPDVMLMDIRMPRLDGIEATRRIVADPDLTAVQIVILTTFELDEYVFEALRAGAAGFLVKDTDAAELLRAIRVVAGGEALLSAERSPGVSSSSSPPAPATPAPRPTWTGSPLGNGKWRLSSPRVSPTTRSPTGST